MPNRSFGSARFRPPLLAVLVGLGLTGCGAPSAVNIELRKQNQTLQAKVDQLTTQHDRDLAALAAAQRGHPTTRALDQQQLDQLFTTHGIKVGYLTGGDNPTADQTTDSQLKVYVVPTDEQGTPIKAAGSFKVQAFDLQDPKKTVLGTWSFDQTQTRDLFFSQMGLYTYVLTCPWQSVPAHADITLRITFDDALTGREFVEQAQAKVRPPVVSVLHQ
jgi:outer membrane murein-binding lipoprotein Lpp